MTNLKEGIKIQERTEADSAFTDIAAAVSPIGRVSELQRRIVDHSEKITIPYGLINRTSQALEYNHEGLLLPHTLAVRIGDIIFIDSRLKNQLLPILNKLKNTQIYWLSDFLSHLDDTTLQLYSLPTSYALSRIPLTGKHVLDLGAADGTQGLIVYRNGARKVTSVEQNTRFRTQEMHYHQILYCDIFSANINLNAMDPHDFSYVQADISTNQTQIAQIAQDAEVVVANIGPAYGESHLAAIDMLKDLPCVTTYIMAGYVKGKQNDDPTFALQQLKEHGFTPTRLITINTLIQTFVLKKEN